MTEDLAAFVLSPLFLVLLTLDVLWELVWKGIGLWKAARNGSKGWFVCILIFNTIGILPILYVFVFSKKR